MRDDESGIVYYSDQMRQVWDGSLRHKKNFETRNPQEFVKAGNDPKALHDTRTDLPYPDAPSSFYELNVGETAVPTPTGPASHLFDVGIGSMEIGGSFVVR